MTFGSEIQRLRKQKGLKQYELAERLGIKPAYVCDIENGRRKPHSNTFIENVCQALDLTIGERLKLYSLSYNLPRPLSNSKQELLSQIATMELRDQLEAKEQMIKELKEQLEVTKRTIAYALDEFIYVDWNDKETRNKRRMKNIEKLQKIIEVLK